MYRVIYLFFGICFISWVGSLGPHGINTAEPVEPFLGVFPEISPSSGDWTLVNAFPNLTFTDPIAMEEVPDQSGYYVAGKHGVIWFVEADSTTAEKTIALDIRDKVITGGDAGLINFTLHPDFGNPSSDNKNYLYIMYPFSPVLNHGEEPRMNRLSRFSVYEGSRIIDPSSEYILIQDYDPQGYHMGGAMFWDEEGYFYFTMGDGGDAVAVDLTPAYQQIDKYLFGGLFRLDLDNDPARSHPIRKQPLAFPGKPEGFPEVYTQGYSIPNDNPFVDESGSTLEEFYGLGLRSPHRADYDELTGQIWIGDVGHGSREEITILPKGGNAQWPYKEGNFPGTIAKPSELIGLETPPKFDYHRSIGVAVIGGIVYRGEKWNHVLDGFYLFGDHSNGNIWSLNPVTDEVILLTTMADLGLGGKRGLSSFATNDAGDIFLLNLNGTNQDGGTIMRMVLDQAPPAPIPNLLSETGAFSDLETLSPAPGFIPYKVNSPLWSDRAAKQRWMAIPNDGIHDTDNEKIAFSPLAPWQFPGGSVFIKHFDLPVSENDPTELRRLETRFYIVDMEGNAYGLTYKWNEEGTDAELLSSGLSESYPVELSDGSMVDQTWEYPSRLQCDACHNPNSGFVLGVKTHQLNGDYLYPSGVVDNQLTTLDHLDIFLGDPLSDPDQLARSYSLDDQEASTEVKVMSYLDANCAHCHQPGGVEGVFDARFTTPLSEKNLVNEFGLSHTTPFGAKMVVPQHPEESELWLRDNSVEADKMPPIAKNIVDQNYMALLTEWINGLDESSIGPCQILPLGELPFANVPENGWGPVEINQDVGDIGEGDGQAILIGGIPFSRGLGTHAYSEVAYNLDCKYDVFSASIGISSRTCLEGSVLFEVWVDQELNFRSDTLRPGDAPEFISLDVGYANRLLLRTMDAGDGTKCDHGNWANAQLEICQAIQKTEISKAFAFGADGQTQASRTAPETEYVKVVQGGDNFLYDETLGYGYTDISGIDPSPNDRNYHPIELYDQFIGTKAGELIFRVDLPNGVYKIQMIGGDADLEADNKRHTIKVRDGSSGFFYTLVENHHSDGGEFFKVGFN
ncbi:MAG: hypothetical protein HKN16_05425, partial [Saprospiraceae bacterium]|nr:hypothetical protein [Saprospiraceae bacterium]